MILFKLAYHSLRNRAATTLLTALSIAISVMLFLGVEKVRVGAREGFNNTISQADLIVGARTGATQLLLYSVFHMGEATNNIAYKSYLAIKKHPSVEWTIPYSLGDSHRGFRVVSTDENFYAHYHYRQDRNIELKEGIPANDVFDVVLGSDVAEKLGYQLGQKIVLSHGISEGGGIEHGDRPFHVVGILGQTGTPIDRSLYITLEGMEAIHIDWQTGAPPEPGKETPLSQITKDKIKITQLTAFIVRTKSRVQSLYLQREINEFPGEPLLAIMPGVALAQLWQIVGYAEDGLWIISLFVVFAGFLGMMTSLYVSLNERRREMAILRAVGAKPIKILFLLVVESFFLTLAGALSGVLAVYVSLWLLRPMAERNFGFYLPITSPTSTELEYLLAILVLGILAGLVPAIKAFRNTLADGLTVRN
ncbi:MAG: ABC transporter permease [Bdellovibrionota bacterium]